MNYGKVDDDLLEELRSVVGPDNVITDPDALDIRPQDATVPDTGVLTESDRSEDVRSRCHEGGCIDFRGNFQVGTSRVAHGDGTVGWGSVRLRGIRMPAGREFNRIESGPAP